MMMHSVQIWPLGGNLRRHLFMFAVNYICHAREDDDTRQCKRTLPHIAVDVHSPGL